MIKKLIEWLKRNPCKTCKYYHKENVCQLKEILTCGNYPYVNLTDRFFCEPYKEDSEVEE